MSTDPTERTQPDRRKNGTAMEDMPDELLLEIMIESQNPALTYVSKRFRELATDERFREACVVATYGNVIRPAGMTWMEYGRFLPWARRKAKHRSVETRLLFPLVGSHVGVYRTTSRKDGHLDGLPARLDLPLSTCLELERIGKEGSDGDMVSVYNRKEPRSFLGCVRTGSSWVITHCRYHVPSELMFRLPINYWNVPEVTDRGRLVTCDLEGHFEGHVDGILEQSFFDETVDAFRFKTERYGVAYDVLVWRPTTHPTGKPLVNKLYFLYAMDHRSVMSRMLLSGNKVCLETTLFLY